MRPVTVTISVHDETTNERMTRSFTFDGVPYHALRWIVNRELVRPIEKLHSEVES